MYVWEMTERGCHKYPISCLYGLRQFLSRLTSRVSRFPTHYSHLLLLHIHDFAPPGMFSILLRGGFISPLPPKVFPTALLFFPARHDHARKTQLLINYH